MIEKMAEEFAKYNTIFEDEFSNDKRAYLAGAKAMLEKCKEIVESIYPNVYVHPLSMRAQGSLDARIEIIAEFSKLEGQPYEQTRDNLQALPRLDSKE